MAGDVYVVVEHLSGKIAEISFEMLGQGREIAAALGGKVCALVLGKGAAAVAAACGSADTVLLIEDDALADFNPEAHTRALAAILAERKPAVVLAGNTSKGMDIAPDLAVSLGIPVLTNVSAVAIEGSAIVATSQLYGGKIWVEAAVAGGRAVLSILAGAFPADKGKSDTPASVESLAAPAGLGTSRIRFQRLIAAEAADVDITKQDVLVSVGRGIQDKDNIAIVQELADAIGCPLSASRPIVDMGWLPKSRQVGKSGVSVKPKIYIAVGISGAPEHVQGMKDASTIVAINSDPKAPIFDVAHFGITADLFDVVPALTEKVKELRG